MAKNELLPFANGEDANVLPTQQWEALTDILENGFQSGIARSEQVNRVLAQGAVASYVLGQLIVDQLNKDATLNKDTLYQNLVSALQETAKDVCLPLGGGTMSGKITSSSDRVLDSTNANGLFIVADASAISTKTGTLSVFPVNHSRADRAGGFQFVASDGTNNKMLTGTYANGLRWAGKNVVCSVNGTAADAAGNVSISIGGGASAKAYITETWQGGNYWYRKYSDGWIEQGGATFFDANGTTVTFPTAFSNNHYTLILGAIHAKADYYAVGVSINANSKTPTSFAGHGWLRDGTAGYYAEWYACGY